MTETEDDEVPEDEEEMIPENENGGNNLEEVLQAEAEILASEIEEALEDGIDASLVQDMEETVESAAEALVTMREARHKLAEVKKDRGLWQGVSYRHFNDFYQSESRCQEVVGEISLF